MTRDIQSALDNRANQLNPEHPAFYLSRGLPQETAEQFAREVARATRLPAKHSDRKAKPQEKSSK